MEEKEFDQLKCPNCGAPLKSDARLCAYCGGENLNYTPPKIEQPETDEQAETLDGGFGQFMGGMVGGMMLGGMVRPMFPPRFPRGHGGKSHRRGRR